MVGAGLLENIDAIAQNSGVKPARTGVDKLR
ncbi:MAG: hypothetical protein N4J56_002566 [Chroococcidiopsis sp. SAG 2025]|nr:hypothetical protein [Chroococcidiopsis sp. SAG 2025]